MFRQLTLTIALALGTLFAVGCESDKPHDYGTDRPPPDAVTPGDTGLQSKDVIAASDLMAAGALRAASELGVRVPDDLAVVGFDDIGLASLITPQLTTVRQDMEALGGAAAIDAVCASR